MVNFKSHLSVFLKRKWTKEFLHSSDNYKVPNTATPLSFTFTLLYLTLKPWIHVEKTLSYLFCFFF